MTTKHNVSSFPMREIEAGLIDGSIVETSDGNYALADCCGVNDSATCSCVECVDYRTDCANVAAHDDDDGESPAQRAAR